MEYQEVISVYSASYAKTYNEKFLLSPFTQKHTDFELSILAELIDKDTSWLDIGCGTGYFLSQFPGVKRAGMDLSPHMLEEAGQVNPDVLFLQQGDFRNEFPEWREKWSLVSAMWNPYCYLESIKEVEKMVTNMINWTSDGGSVFIPTIDIEDIRPNVVIPYEEKAGMYGGATFITGYYWSWFEHESIPKSNNMIAPHAEHFVRLLAPYFETVELLRYPPYQPGWVSRKAVVARKKRNEVAEQKANIIRHPIPPPSFPGPYVSNTTCLPAGLSNKQLIKELYLRIRSGNLPRSFFRWMSNF